MMDFGTPKAVLPTPEESRVSSLRWYEPLKGTSLDELPDAVMALSTPTTFIGLPKELINVMYDEQDKSPLNDLAAEIDAALNWSHKVPKLQTRSPKDVWPKGDPWTVAGRQVLEWMMLSQRCMDDLIRMEYHPDLQPKICLRDPIWMLKQIGEFRCFVKDGSLIAVTAYDYTQETPEVVVDHAKKIRGEIDKFWGERLHSEMHMQTYVFDVCYSHGNALTLIEINPYGLSDPCWFGSYAQVERAAKHIQTAAPEGAL